METPTTFTAVQDLFREVEIRRGVARIPLYHYMSRFLSDNKDVLELTNRDYHFEEHYTLGKCRKSYVVISESLFNDIIDSFRVGISRRQRDTSQIFGDA